MEENVKVREDLNEIVLSIGYIPPEKSRFNVAEFKVRLFNGVTLDFRDKDGLYDLMKTYEFAGLQKNEFIKSKKLVEEIKNANDDLGVDATEGENSTYLCVKYVLVRNGIERTFRLFPSKRAAYEIINTCYDVYKRNKKETKKSEVK